MECENAERASSIGGSAGAPHAELRDGERGWCDRTGRTETRWRTGLAQTGPAGRPAAGSGRGDETGPAGRPAAGSGRGDETGPAGGTPAPADCAETGTRGTSPGRARNAAGP